MIQDILYYIKPEQRLKYIQKLIHPADIDPDKIAVDYSIPLSIKFYENNWQEMTFEILIDTLVERYGVKEAANFVNNYIPVKLIYQKLYLFSEYPYVKLLRPLMLNNLGYTELLKLLEPLPRSKQREAIENFFKYNLIDTGFYSSVLLMLGNDKKESQSITQHTTDWFKKLLNVIREKI